jgi:uncharacterized protein (DUF885 family)
MRGILLAPFLCIAAVTAQGQDVSESAAQRVRHLADTYYQMQIGAHPEMVLFYGLDVPDPGGLTSNRQADVARRHIEEGKLLHSLRQIDREVLTGQIEWVVYGILEQSIRASQDLQVCRQELWNVNHMGGWQVMFPRLMELHPIGDNDVRLMILERMSDLVLTIDREMQWLRQGLEQGYSAPKPVVKRVIRQVDGLLALDRRDTPLLSPIWRDKDQGFLEQGLYFYEDETVPMLTAYRDFLENEYLPGARASLAVTANPEGRACYEASLRDYTTLDRSPEEVFRLGQATVESNRARLIELGRKAYGLDDFTAIMARIAEDQSDKFADAEEMLAFSREAVERAERAMPEWFGALPGRAVEVQPYPDHLEGTGMSSRYEAGAADRPGIYRISRHEPRFQSKGNAESTAFHETWPGHHLQISIGQELKNMHPIVHIAGFSGMIEGWARYSESLADEMGLYSTTTGPIARLAWPARGMVVDPGIHVMGWTREQAIEFMAESGRFTPGELEDMVDRIAILPGQLTAYDSGGLEIVALRELAQSRLGDAFDIKTFHDRVLENGSVPLTVLRAHIESWLGSGSESG